MFNPIADYLVEQKPIHIEDFHRYREDFVVRPPYQRTSVWSKQRQQQLLDSLIRRYYVPRIVLREVRLDEHSVKKEVIDGNSASPPSSCSSQTRSHCRGASTT